MGIGDWGLGPIPNPQISFIKNNYFKNKAIINIYNKQNLKNLT